MCAVPLAVSIAAPNCSELSCRCGERANELTYKIENLDLPLEHKKARGVFGKIEFSGYCLFVEYRRSVG